jgi:hypothetical protein
LLSPLTRNGGCHERNLWRDLGLRKNRILSIEIHFQKRVSWRKKEMTENTAIINVEFVEIEELEQKLAPSGSVPMFDE